MSDRLREALDLLSTEDGLLNRISRHNADEFVEAVAVVSAVGRRWLALTETGPDYEAAKQVIIKHLGPRNPEVLHVAWDAAAHRIVDAAIADYLTEEE